MQLLLVCQLFNICKTEKKISIYKKYVYNSSQSNFNLFVNHTYIKIVIIPAMDISFLKRQYNVVIQPVGYSLKQLFYY